MTTIRIMLICAALALAVGCGGEQADTSSESTTAEAPDDAAEGPSVTFSADKTQAVQPGDEITLTVDVKDFTLDESKIGGANESGIGHYRVYLDDASGDDYLAESAAGTVKVKVPEDVTDGSHPLRVVLHNNDGTPLEPAAESEVWLIIYRL